MRDSKPLSTPNNAKTKHKSLFRKIWWRIFVWKYPITILIGIWGAIPALQPGVNGLKTYGDILATFSTARVERSSILNPDKLNIEWCYRQDASNIDGFYSSATCGIRTKAGRSVWVMEPAEKSDNRYRGMLKFHSIDPYTPGEADEVDYLRDWEQYRFFYGYGRLVPLARAASSVRYVHQNASFGSVLLIFLFICFDLLIGLLLGVFRICSALIWRLKK